MPRITIPTQAGRLRVERHFAGKHFLVMNDKSGKNEVCFPVGTKAAAEEWCRRLNAGEHGGTISVPALKR